MKILALAILFFGSAFEVKSQLPLVAQPPGSAIPQIPPAYSQCSCPEKLQEMMMRVSRGSKRPSVKPKYIEIIYDADAKQLWWYDPRSGPVRVGSSIVIEEDKVFPPVTFANERILVTVCGAKFGTETTTSTATTVIPESLSVHGIESPNVGISSKQDQVQTMIRMQSHALDNSKAPPTPPAQISDKAKALIELSKKYAYEYQNVTGDIQSVICTTVPKNCAIDTIGRTEYEAAQLLVDVHKNGDPHNIGEFVDLSSKTQNLIASFNNLNSGNVATLQTELQTLTKDYNALVDAFNAADAPTVAATGLDPNNAFTPEDASKVLTNAIKAMHDAMNAVFTAMNELRDRSSVDFTDIVTPSAGNAVLTVHIIVHDTFVPFSFSISPPKSTDGTKDGSAPALGASQKPNGTGQQSLVAAEQHEVRRVLVEVHRKADANLVGGFAISTIPTRSFGFIPAPPIGSPPVVLQVAFQGPNTVQVTGIAGINWYLRKRDYFPGYLTWKDRITPGILLATSVTSLGNVFLGADIEPFNGIDLYATLNIGQKTNLAPGVIPGVTLFSASATTVPTRQTTAYGFAGGIGFNFSIFSSIFSKGSAPSAAASH
jgi:hypothetical protein